MRRFPIVLFSVLLLFCPLIANSEAPSASLARALYERLGLEGEVDFGIFEQAYTGFSKIDGRRKELLTLIDFSKPSTRERLYVIDMKRERVIHYAHVAHGRGSGDTYATSFGNGEGSHKSSLGFYLTAEAYNGANGYSLRLDGLEKGINDHARERAVVIHGADYADPAFIAANGRLGRSLGCPALPPRLNRPIIDDIKGGSVLYIYAPAPGYLLASNFIK